MGANTSIEIFRSILSLDLFQPPYLNSHGGSNGGCVKYGMYMDTTRVKHHTKRMKIISGQRFLCSSYIGPSLA